MVLFHKCSCISSFYFFRSLYTNSVLKCSHYKVLGLTPSATQAEIKSAYYELSKLHHPDKNQGSEKSAKLFREITTAYEILGNEKSRKQYDIEQFSRRKYESSNYRNESYATDYNYEAEKRFYERRMRGTRRVYYGKTPYYDFDAWIRSHYSAKNYYSPEFKVKVKFYYNKETAKPDHVISKKIVVLWRLFLLVLGITFVLSWLRKRN